MTSNNNNPPPLLPSMESDKSSFTLDNDDVPPGMEGFTVRNDDLPPGLSATATSYGVSSAHSASQDSSHNGSSASSSHSRPQTSSPHPYTLPYRVEHFSEEPDIVIQAQQDRQASEYGPEDAASGFFSDEELGLKPIQVTPVTSPSSSVETDFEQPSNQQQDDDDEVFKNDESDHTPTAEIVTGVPIPVPTTSASGCTRKGWAVCKLLVLVLGLVAAVAVLYLTNVLDGVLPGEDDNDNSDQSKADGGGNNTTPVPTTPPAHISTTPAPTASPTVPATTPPSTVPTTEPLSVPATDPPTHTPTTSTPTLSPTSAAPPPTASPVSLITPSTSSESPTPEPSSPQQPTASPSVSPTALPTARPTTPPPTASPSTTSPTTSPTTFPLFQLYNNPPLESQLPHMGFGATVQLSDNGQVLAVASVDGSVLVYDWKAPNWVARGSVLLGGPIMTLSGDGQVLAFQHQGTLTTLAYNGQDWALQGSPLPSGAMQLALSYNGTVLVAGEPTFDEERGRVVRYDYDQDWSETDLVLPSVAAGDRMGASVALSSDTTAAVGSPGVKSGIGVVHVYDKQGQPVGSTVEGSAAQEGLGVQVALEHPRLLVAATRQGAVKVYRLNGGGNRYVLRETFADHTYEKMATAFHEGTYMLVLGYVTCESRVTGETLPCAEGNGEPLKQRGWIQLWQSQGNLQHWNALGDDLWGEEIAPGAPWDLSLSHNGHVVAVGLPDHGVGGATRVWRRNMVGP